MKSNYIYIFLIFSLIFCFGFIPEISHALSKNQYYEQYNAISQSKDWEKGETVFKEAVKKYPNEVTFQNFYNFVLRNRKKFTEALLQIEKFYPQFPNDKYVIENYKWSLHQLGWEKDKQGNKQDAFQLFKKSYQLINDEQWGLNAWGYILKEVGRLDESVEVLTRGRKLFPGHKPIQQNLIASLLTRGSKFLDQKQLQLAYIDYFAAQKLDPKHEWTILNIGNYYRANGEFEKARKTLEQGLILYPKNKYFKPNLTHSIYEHGKDEFQKGNTDKAIEILKNGNAAFKDEIWFYYYLAEYHIKKSENALAGDYLLKMAVINSKKREASDFYHIEASIFHRMKQVLNNLANNQKTGAIFKIISKLQNHVTNKYFILQLNGIQTYHSGAENKGIDMVYQAYDVFIKAFPQYQQSFVVDSPLKGIYIVKGNSRRDAITHAGLDQFCFDFIGSSKEGEFKKTASNKMGKNSDYQGFGNPVYSTVDGIVESFDGNYADLKPAPNYRLIDGNYITIKDTKGRHHLFAHLKQNSLKVAVGQSVKTGQMIAELGNSGMTTIPHLHYGVYSSDWVVSLPVRFRNYTLLENDYTQKRFRHLNQTMQNSTPANNTIIKME